MPKDGPSKNALRHPALFFKGAFGLKLREDFFLLIPPPHSRSSKFNSPPRKSELVSDWLKFTRARVKTLRRFLFRISIMVWEGGIKSVGGGGINRKDHSPIQLRLFDIKPISMMCSLILTLRSDSVHFY